MDYLAQLMESFRVSATKECDRQQQIARHVAVLKHYEHLTGNFKLLVTSLTSSAPNANLPVVSINSNNVITIEEIINAGADVVHPGKILLCRSILPTVKMSALCLLVDDPDGKFALRLALYNFSKSVHPGTILAIMHPWFKNAADGSTALRCDNPTHVQFLKSTDSILANIIWKADLPVESGVKKNVSAIKSTSDGDTLANQGTRYYMEKNYSKALEFYTKAIKRDPKNPIFYANRALTYLALQKPSQALADADAGIDLDKSHLKSLYRKAKALLMLKLHREAVDFLDETQQRLKKELDGNREFTKLTEISKNMLREYETGVYDLEKMGEEAKRCKILENHADYSASIFEIKEIHGKGRGLVATRKIPGDTLIMACKAFAFAIDKEDKITLATNYATKTIEPMGFTEMVQQICDKLMANPELGRDFYQLHAGAALGILRNYDPSNPVDVDRISSIVRMNSFSTNEGGLTDFDWVKGESGLWLQPSFLNHSCSDFNCLWTTIGDFMFVRTIKKIKRGEELLIAYVSPLRSYEERSKAFENHWGFTCSCSLCVADRQRLG